MREISEHQEQATLMRWVHINTGRLPQLKWLFAVPNGGQRHIATAVKLKQEGVKRGVPDLMFPVPQGKYAGLAIEMKTRKGRVSPEQHEWIEGLRSNGWKALVCRGWEDASKELEKYLA